jgi:23S rRNA (uracil1939-C5)-methyltransferase
MIRGERHRLTIERPAAGGRMIARHDGSIVFVSGAIPGEVVDAEVERIQKGTIWAKTTNVVERSPDRVDDGAGNDCGGAVFSHIAYERQLRLKSEIITDAFRRIGRLPVESATDVVPSVVAGHRMRARLHVRSGKIGFFREGSHALCDPAATRQLRDDTVQLLARVEASLQADAIVSELEISENIAASERVLHLELRPGADVSRLASRLQIDGLTGATCAHAENPRTIELLGSPLVSDQMAGATLSRHVRSFFQGNRFLTPQLASYVLSLVESGAVLDLYAGVGLFSVTVAANGRGTVTAVEGDRYSAADLQRNAAGHAVIVKAGAVEAFVARSSDRYDTVIVDPPRTGVSKDALAGVIALKCPRLIYVSCDVATLARDSRVLADAGYRIVSARAFDMFPTTAHIETVMAFARE